MPCSDGRDYGGESRELQRRVDELTQILCLVGKWADGDSHHTTNMPYSFRVWWSEHKKVDARRREQEKQQNRRAILAQRAKEKLTREEREALGL